MLVSKMMSLKRLTLTHSKSFQKNDAATKGELSQLTQKKKKRKENKETKAARSSLGRNQLQ